MKIYLFIVSLILTFGETFCSMPAYETIIEESKFINFSNPQDSYIYCLRNCTQVPPDMNQGNKDALRIALHYKMGITVDKNLSKCLHLLSVLSCIGMADAQFWMGKIFDEQKNYELAVRWYMLSFQNKWYQDPEAALKSKAFEELEKINQDWATESNFDIEFIKLIYAIMPRSIVKDDTTLRIGQYYRGLNLVQYNKSHLIEPYLSCEEIDLKNKILDNFNQTILNNHRLEIDDINAQIKEGVAAFNNRIYALAYQIFQKIIFVPEALYYIALIHDDKDLNPATSIYYYLKAATPLSFYQLGVLYYDGRYGTVDDKPNFESSYKYFMRSDCYETDVFTANQLFNGSLFIFCSAKPNHEMFLEHLEHMMQRYPNDSFAYRYHANFFFLDIFHHLPGHPNLTLSYYSFLKALELGGLEKEEEAYIYCNLGSFMEGNQIPEIGEELSFQKALHYYIKSGTSESLYRIGLLYSRGILGKIDGRIDCNTALYYLKQSDKINAKLKVLKLYTIYKKNKLKFIKKQYKDIINFSNKERDFFKFYIQGMAQFYMKMYNESLVRLTYVISIAPLEWEYNEKTADKITVLKEKLGLSEGHNDMLSVLDVLTISEPIIDATKVSDTESKFFEDEFLEDESSMGSSVDEEELIEKSHFLSPTLLPLEISHRYPDKLSKFNSGPVFSKLSKMQKKQAHIARIKASFTSPKSVDLPGPDKTELKLVFENSKFERDFTAFRKDNAKVNELLADIALDNHNTSGAGKPKILRGDYKSRQKIYSRRINNYDRLMYTVEAPHTIKILSWQGHY